MKRTLSLAIALSTVALLALFVPARPALAHGHTTVGDYELVIGFHNEPAYQGEPNGLDLFVTNTKTGAKVNGLEKTLKAAISFGGTTKELEIEAQWGQEGAYTAHVLPVRDGDYTWRIFGTIEGTPVDVSMTSSPDTFGSVQPKAAVAFPNAEPTAAELQGQLAAAEQQVRTGLVVGIVGAVLGLAGLVLGALALMRRPAAPATRAATASAGD
jgi:hypothetical protein